MQQKLNQAIIEHAGLELWLLKEKAIWLPELQTLLISDVHFGKAAHFRKSGIPIPEPIHDRDLELLASLFEQYSPTHVYFLGDLFHSDWNGQWSVLMQFLDQFEEVTFHLVLGNHDILSDDFYTDSRLQIHKEPVIYGALMLSHEPMDFVPEGLLNLCGHIHPGIRLRGLGRQSVRISCFFWEKQRLILPAFGNFTGLALMKAAPTAKIYGITTEKVILIQS
ncbi:ligase-associated DNA damage response endonuclease PdeM [Algoriphagus vanfongensis]|uniref:ligase-associated DNA damage response endonuclease PdeM n=1 Tax=Algoriphagus vanfongensis TaxID=426371 RepID=UPI0003F51E0E|nr:ligase-associated DNA damage response endonuclease PdeM [Algoriphagus vanfongensis]